MGNTYNIPDASGIYLLSPAKSAAIGALYGIGIGKAIAAREASAGRGWGNYEQNYDVSTSENPAYDPDAYPSYRNGVFSGYESLDDRWDGKMSQSLSGMPVMCSLKFIGGDYVDLAGNLVTIPDIEMETVITANVMTKNINAENIFGRDTGSVKEFMGMGDWSVDVRAIITADAPLNQTIARVGLNGTYPRENMKELMKLLRSPISVPIECWYLEDILGIKYLAINSGSEISQIEGEYEMQRVFIPCLSDNPLVIRIAR